VIGEVHKFFFNKGRRPPCWFWRTVQGEEVDLLIETGPRKFAAIECKTAAQVEPRALKGFTALEKAYGENGLEKAAVVCRTEDPYPLARKSRVLALPLHGKKGLAHWLSKT
jgi:hypothetical protein